MILDVREDDEVAGPGGMIADAQHIPMGRVFTEMSKGNIAKDKKIVTVCKSGVRSEIVAKELRERGYDIESLEGGMDLWRLSL